jgi:ribonuclease R
VAQCLANDIHADKRMDAKCKHSSEMERKAMEAERAGNKYKQVEYMQQFLGETFDGVVSGVAHFGFWVETVETKCEGLVALQSMTTRDEFRYDENEYALIGSYTGRKIRIGDKVKVQVAAASLEKRQLDYELIEEDEDGFPVQGRVQRREEDDAFRQFRNREGGDRAPRGRNQSSDKRGGAAKGKGKPTAGKKKSTSDKKGGGASRKKA